MLIVNGLISIFFPLSDTLKTIANKGRNEVLHLGVFFTFSDFRPFFGREYRKAV
jgi:hypothetical protein